MNPCSVFLSYETKFGAKKQENVFHNDISNEIQIFQEN